LTTPAVAIVHDYLTQRGGAERVVLSMLRAFPGASLYTSLYEPAATFPEFAETDIKTSALNRVPALRRHHRLALPVLAPAFSRLDVDAEVAICSSSGWAHGAHVTGRKLVYCHAPARWLYQTDRYVRDRGAATRAALSLLAPALRHWDRRAARGADRYLVNSTAVRDAAFAAYGITADVLPPPPALSPGGGEVALDGIEPGFVLCVARLLPYKNVDAVIAAADAVDDLLVVVVGTGPDEERLRARASDRVHFAGAVPDEQLRWLYRSAALLVAVSYEDYGLTPLEAAAFGTPCVALRFGGYLDTVVEGETGVLVEQPNAHAVAAGIRRALDREWDAERLVAHAECFSEQRFVARLRSVVTELAA
jgi:glycosyltransferase involved in cell wall biosynthesis